MDRNRTAVRPTLRLSAQGSVTMQSILQRRGAVAFPGFTGERVYMRPFTKRKGLPFDLRRWQPTVDAMLDGVDVAGPIYIMVDQGIVQPGTTQRRPGLHIDGYWIPAIRAHGAEPRDDWGQELPKGEHSSEPRLASPGGHNWSHSNFNVPEALILASDVTASRALVGQFDSPPGQGGDYTHLDTTGLTSVLLEAGAAYAGNVTMLHESLPLAVATPRTLVRLNVPGWSPEMVRA